MFYVVLTFHLLAITAKLAVLFLIPRLRSVEQTRRFLATYRKLDCAADVVLWSTGIAFFFVTSFQYLMQMWLIVSMLLYMFVFYMMKRFLMRGLVEVANSRKIYAEKELKTLRFQNLCVGLFSIFLMGCIAFMMMNKPF
ncbi:MULTISPECIES: hypothetical protein [Aneurinibacillus]|uniref:Uncharacterized protein n=1 Tax=Aneurinibacillus thermoaerophilus TaxID=143495 RepID=A0A1G7X9K1_ANETH|nr:MULTISPECIES: hypothetical protein [Aneurinibacillus]AMA73268.1 hypothetical protein ACH33_10635 [Aneurinibacillus sp. XH2]MED0674298.1 hypothetical protein [Aneurinibacillus thermoaerophilus]MED0678316.1 hypothetical protein [Aneurinibacillus thermoaerophilus]MED0736158.1 hypothetical protein [Aneurinibacillus thermoaerophilus]MED0757004.1 hypothetical protein [Aneurinibacillus thermoaerophilus]